MTDIVLIGAGGCMRELAWQIIESNKVKKEWNIVGYIDKLENCCGQSVRVADTKIDYLGDDDYIVNIDEDVNVILSIGNPSIRKNIYEMYSKNSHVLFPNIVLANTVVCDDIIMGQGCIVSMNAKISTNVIIGDFVFVNMDVTICHDGRIGDFVSLNPAVKLAGAVTIGEKTEIGMGSNIIQGTNIGNNVVIGAGCVVISDTENNCTMVGVPARKVR